MQNQLNNEMHNHIVRYGELIGIQPEQMEQLLHWIFNVFIGTESLIFGGLVISLLYRQEDLSADDIGNRFPDELTGLPWRGCEQRVAEQLIAEIRERGQSDADIAAIARTMAVIVRSWQRYIQTSPAACSRFLKSFASELDARDTSVVPAMPPMAWPVGG